MAIVFLLVFIFKSFNLEIVSLQLPFCTFYFISVNFSDENVFLYGF